MKTVTYVRKPFEVEAAQVTEDNLNEIQDWCQGTIMSEDDGAQYVKVRVNRAMNERQTKAFPGDWVLFAGTGFKVYTNKAFAKTFQKAAAEPEVVTPVPPTQAKAEAPTGVVVVSNNS